MNISPESEIKKIYEKSVRLLNDKQARLMGLQQILKKAVMRLSYAAKGGNEKVNTVLDSINDAVDDHVDMDLLNSQLDNLFVLVNQSDGSANTSVNNTFNSCLSKALDKFQGAQESDAQFLKLQSIAKKDISDELIALEILKFIDSATDNNHQYTKDVNLFIGELTDKTDFLYDVESSDISLVMQDMAAELVQFLNNTQNNSELEKNLQSSSATDISNINVKSLFLEVVNQLTLPTEAKRDQFQLAKKLNNQSNKESWTDIIQQLVYLINNSIGVMQAEKLELQTYLTKINMQLADIESYMHLMHKEHEDDESNSIMLTDSIEGSVLRIEETVEKSEELPGLKKEVAAKLKDIRKHVEDYKLADEQKDKISTQTYAKIIDELVQSQQESGKLKEQLDESKLQLLRDTLTGVPNRLAYDERVVVEMNRWKRNKSPLSVAIWDIDHFKNINDSYGHGVGDRVLKLFAEIIQSRIRKVDLFARIGGEEFVLLMPDTPIDIALTLSNKLRVMLDECNFHYDGNHCHITSSVGIAQFQEGDEASDVLERADAALYNSKNNGRNQCTVCKDDLHKITT